jgi:translin
MDLEQISSELRDELDAKNTAREVGLSSCRRTIRACGNAIRALHRYELETAEALIAEAQSSLNEAANALEDHPDVRYAGFYHDAEKELVEARLTFGLVTGRGVPAPKEMGSSPQAYAKGMAESIGELRRHILDLMRHGELKRCEELLGAMDDMYYVLVSMDYPDGITFGLRRLTDVARSIIERTRGDYTTSTIQSSLREALEAHASNLEGRDTTR